MNKENFSHKNTVNLMKTLTVKNSNIKYDNFLKNINEAIDFQF